MSYTKTEMNKREVNNGERNPFQRNNRSNNYPRSNGPSGYSSWKNKSAQAQAPPKEKVLTADDFPALPSSAPAKPKGAWGSTSDTTLADRVKDVIAKEEEAKARGYKEEEKEEELDVIPLSSWMREKYLAKKREEAMKRREDEEYEANYRWQISPKMFPPKPEPEMPEYDEEILDGEEEMVEYEDHGVVEYEDRH
jgi:hypothetical protein